MRVHRFANEFVFDGINQRHGRHGAPHPGETHSASTSLQFFLLHSTEHDIVPANPPVHLGQSCLQLGMSATTETIPRAMKSAQSQ